MLRALAGAPGYAVSRMTGRQPSRLPMNLTFSVSYQCNSTCLTCNVWRKRVADLSLDEYDRIFRALGPAPYWLTFSGGEPFLRRDLPDIILAACRHGSPGIVNVPTNAILTERIVSGVERLVREAPRTALVINLSLDGIGDDHDRLRGVPGNYRKLRQTLEGLRGLRAPNLTVGIHAVVSRMNVAQFPALMDHVRDELRPDSFICELAEERVELDTIGVDLTPDAEAYQPVVERLQADIAAHPAAGVAGIAQAFRHHYYEVALRTLREERQVLPCAAGIASGHVAPNGDVWTCCIRAEPIGNLRDVEYDLARIWWNERADTMRASIAAGECHCPLANAAYSSMLSDPSSLARVGWRWLTSRARASS